MCAAAGIDGILSADILVPLWQKFLVLVPLANVNGLTRVPLGRYRADPDTWALVEASLRETEAVGRAEGVALPPDALDHALATAALDAGPSHDLDGQRSVARQPARTAVVRRQGRRTGPPVTASRRRSANSSTPR